MEMYFLRVEGELRLQNRNAIVAVLIKKHDRAERFWSWVERLTDFSRKAG
jgi:hypothetical protein